MIIDEFLSAFILIILYVIFLFILKEIGWKKKQKCDKCNNCCPDCQNALNRVPRKSTDHLINNLIMLKLFFLVLVVHVAKHDQVRHLFAWQLQ